MLAVRRCCGAEERRGWRRSWSPASRDNGVGASGSVRQRGAYRAESGSSVLAVLKPQVWAVPAPAWRRSRGGDASAQYAEVAAHSPGWHGRRLEAASGLQLALGGKGCRLVKTVRWWAGLWSGQSCRVCLPVELALRVKEGDRAWIRAKIGMCSNSNSRKREKSKRERLVCKQSTVERSKKVQGKRREMVALNDDDEEEEEEEDLMVGRSLTLC
ncbi:hypothetical protein J5N97_026838 [Dioscorea zingiberensis]|uniref:Uncharacterized protein n=1 Tax=Dioscorea zingiberensis TaxID=325984 RepID=A0A9D5H751_9LILI|nr:hypothetical protein J5N97_026838 [Dioscorea zingiberensis]